MEGPGTPQLGTWALGKIVIVVQVLGKYNVEQVIAPVEFRVLLLLLGDAGQENLCYNSSANLEGPIQS